jgi:hypothetical protein
MKVAQTMEGMTIHQIQKPATHFRFLNLPVELRLQIYDEFYTSLIQHSSNNKAALISSLVFACRLIFVDLMICEAFFHHTVSDDSCDKVKEIERLFKADPQIYAEARPKFD